MIRLLATLSIAAVLPSVATGQAREEYRLKAAFLFNFTRFVEWPAQAFKSSRDPIAICLVGKNPFGDTLADSVNGKISQNRPLIVIPIADPAQAATCHVLFVPASERKKLGLLLDATAGRGVLTVGETESFLADGGVISLKLDDRKIRIQVNPGAADQQHLKISSKLLSLAEIVKGAR